MILIWHNGGVYSDKTIYFIDAGDRALELSDALTKMSFSFYKPYTIAIVESVDWRVPESMMSIKSFVSDLLTYPRHAEGCDTDWDTSCACPVGDLKRRFGEEKE